MSPLASRSDVDSSFWSRHGIHLPITDSPFLSCTKKTSEKPPDPTYFCTDVTPHCENKLSAICSFLSTLRDCIDEAAEEMLDTPMPETPVTSGEASMVIFFTYELPALRVMSAPFSSAAFRAFSNFLRCITCRPSSRRSSSERSPKTSPVASCSANTGANRARPMLRSQSATSSSVRSCRGFTTSAVSKLVAVVAVVALVPVEVESSDIIFFHLFLPNFHTATTERREG
mmetsp:Transcript_18579/g.46819  ORF Transcript_18579/g.46819 Transcript_18579/m.46819 type:complete len:229 (-) Transcript_18579:107-793(-)